MKARLGVVIGKRCFRLREGDDVRPYILGYTCVNDVTARDLQNKDNQWSTRARASTRSARLGRWSSMDSIRGRVCACRLTSMANCGRTALPSTFSFRSMLLLRYITSVMTLEPGDLIATGTPQGVSPVKAGDVVEVTVEGVGTLRNPLVDRK